MTRHPQRPAGLLAALAAIACLSAPIHARDPAAVGGGSDPALVGGYSTPAASALPVGGGGFSQAMMQRENSIGDAEQLLSQVRGQLNGTASSGTREGDKKNALQYRSEVESMIRDNWNQLGPLTRDLYSSEYGRSNPYDNTQRYRSPYGDNGQMESQLLGATEDVQGAMQGMEDLLLPLLKDLKQGFDNSLRQNAIRR
ncbi:MAG: hypothetical protein J0M09_13955 [Xanthomonadales bacterium]|nr:hypothetical protein [Xanthomonadales bacterium]